jgi:hypothetical protein
MSDIAFGAVWRPGSGAQWVRSGMSGDEFKTQDTAYFGQGLRVSSLAIRDGKIAAVASRHGHAVGAVGHVGRRLQGAGHDLLRRRPARQLARDRGRQDRSRLASRHGHPVGGKQIRQVAPRSVMPWTPGLAIAVSSR